MEVAERQNMKIEKIPLEKTGAFSRIFLDYLKEDDKVRPYYNLYPRIENFLTQINDRKGFDNKKRIFLREAINTQYSGIEKREKFIENLKNLASPTAFTITTGHQLNLFTGPLYFIYKIVTTINLCKQLKTAYPSFHFIPVYWMASEDHDFAEINHFSLFNKEYAWQTDQTGPVGRFHLQGMEEIIEALPEKLALFERAYQHQKNLADATRFFVNELFGNEGLVIVDPDHPLLKKELKSVVRDELFNQYSNKAVEETTSKLEKAGYERQVSGRDINLFYIENGLRERIVKEGDLFHVLNTNKRFDETGILEMVERHPENFSPNVVLRPLYQEMILPNLAYVGGPAEAAYWLQLKKVFDLYKTPFPIIIPRNFALVINKNSARKLRKININYDDLFDDLPGLIDKYLAQNGKEYRLDREVEAIKKVFVEIQNKAGQVDAGLKSFIGAEEAKTLKSLDHIEKKMKKAEEKRHEIALSQLESLKEKLFPDGKLQERKDNFLNFYLNDPEFLNLLLQNLEPLDFKMNVFIEES